VGQLGVLERWINLPPGAELRVIAVPNARLFLRARSALRQGEMFTWQPDVHLGLEPKPGHVPVKLLGRTYFVAPVIDRLVKETGCAVYVATNQLQLHPRRVILKYTRVTTSPEIPSLTAAAYANVDSEIRANLGQWSQWKRYLNSAF
jgi:lauroyl/myristoyl acyltransferase